jgi:DNA polymerase-3 subunit beta
LKIEKKDLVRYIKVLRGMTSKAGNSSGGLLLKDGRLIASAYDISVSAALPAHTAECFILPPNALGYIEALCDGPMEITEAAGKVKIKSGAGSASFTTTETRLFPNVKFDCTGEGEKLSAEMLGACINSVLHALPHAENVKPEMGGIFIQGQNGQLDVVATDGFRVARRHLKLPLDVAYSIPKETASKISAMKLTGDITIRNAEKGAVFESGDYWIRTNTYNASEYFNFHPLFEQEYPIKIAIKRVDLLGTVSRAIACAGEDKKTSPLIFTISDGTMTAEVQSTTAEFSEELELSAALETGKQLRIGMNQHYVLEALKVMDSEKVTLGFGTAISPVLFSGGDHEEIILPVRIKEGK